MSLCKTICAPPRVPRCVGQSIVDTHLMGKNVLHVESLQPALGDAKLWRFKSFYVVVLPLTYRSLNR